MTDGIAEILIRISEINDEDERVAELRKANDRYPAIYKVLKHGFCRRIKWNLPPGTPPFEKQKKAMDLQGNLHSKIRNFEYFVQGNYPDMKPHQREKVFIGMLETCDPDDADLLIMVKDRKIRYNKRITPLLCRKAWPDRTDDDWK